jgi:hypothetical protein
MTNTTAKIGETAGRIWQYLRTNGITPVSSLPKELKETSPVVHQGLGWLAREGKIEYTVEKKKTFVGLTE